MISKPDVEGLTKLIDRFQDTPMVVVGDLILDHYVWGRVDRISPEAPVVVVHVTEENKRLGGAGNVARNLKTLGAKVTVCGVVGDDDAGRALISMIDELGANSDSVLVDRSRMTTVKTRVIAHSQQVVRVDREIVTPLADTYAHALAAAVQSTFSSTRGIIVSDYAKGTIGAQLFDRISDGVAQGLIGLDKIPVLVDPKAPNFLLYRNASVIKPNRREAEDASGMSIRNRESGVLAAQSLLERWQSEMVLVTLGEHGMVLVGKDAKQPVIEVETEAREVFDVSGAGDTVSAVFTLALAAGGTPSEAAYLSNLAAGIVVGEIGTVAVEADELRAALKRSRE